jgi:Spy/CpxP family protein refolding chaperone
MNTRKKLAILPVLLLAAAVGAEHPDGHDGWEKKKEARMEEMQKKLNLTPEQKARLQEHRKAHKGQGKHHWEQMKQKKEALKQELEKPDMDEAKVKALHAEMQELHRQAADHRLQGILEVRKILTPEQFKQFHEMMHEKRGRHGGMGKERGPGHRKK